MVLMIVVLSACCSHHNDDCDGISSHWTFPTAIFPIKDNILKTLDMLPVQIYATIILHTNTNKNTNDTETKYKITKDTNNKMLPVQIFSPCSNYNSLPAFTETPQVEIPFLHLQIFKYKRYN